MQEVRHVSYV